MARATAECTCKVCGATFAVTAVKRNRREADSWESWAVEYYDICDDCKRAEREAKAAKLAEQAKADGLPELTGTPKQLVWAEQIRGEFIDAANASIEELRELAKEPGQLYKADETLAIAEKTLAYILDTQSKAGWWIDHRGAYPRSLISRFWDMHQTEIEMHSEQTNQDETEADEAEALMTPENPTHGTATVTVDDETVIASYPKDDDFRKVVKDHGFKFNPNSSTWRLVCGQFTGPAVDRAADITASLLRAGFCVKCARQDVREMAISGTYAPMVTRWIKMITAGAYIGWLCIELPYNDPEHDKLRKDALRIKGAKYHKYDVLVPVASHALAEDFARINGYSLSTGVQQAILDYETARVTVTPANPEKIKQPDVLGDILASDDAILPDLADE